MSILYFDIAEQGHHTGTNSEFQLTYSFLFDKLKVYVNLKLVT